ncbi:uncharacterized protein LOC107629176 isoform X4 [Arachis ipaensis]|uniref:uncharacterized protein LOC107629176 isoform X4 n=1 Tax=Arachis ipaensis TaxID=130454 RepID=UPI000A2B3075|nr:uncharacterized protein LOC107629176 isoform X4 [Arachis ipaensis]
MASFSVEEFIGNGVLKELLPNLLEEGWEDVPTLKVMNSEDMDSMNMTQKQKEALGIRTYLHDCGLMQYADKIEACGRSLPELLNLSTIDLSAQFDMKRGHIARFINRTRFSDPHGLQALSARRTSMSYKEDRIPKRLLSNGSNSMMRSNEYSLAEPKIKEGYVFKGIVASEPADPRACGCVKPPPAVDQVAPYSAIENISVQKLTPEYKIGMEPLVKTKTPPMKASELWRHKPAVFLCLRRPGCIMCRAEAHKLFSQKPIFDALGVQLFAVLHEHIEAEILGRCCTFRSGKGFLQSSWRGQSAQGKVPNGISVESSMQVINHCFLLFNMIVGR